MYHTAIGALVGAMDYDHKTNYVRELVERDVWMMDVLKVVKSLNLPDWWIGAGFVRNKVWDTLHGFEKRTMWPGMDVDVIYFNKDTTDPKVDQELELLLYSLKPGVPWSATNQARMHMENEDPPYSSSVDALSQWPETATCVGIKLDEGDKIELVAPYGWDDVTGMKVRPNLNCRGNPQKFILRLSKKQWQVKWPKAAIFYE